MLIYQNKSGFAPVFIAIGFAVVAAISFTAYRVVSSGSDENSPSKDTISKVENQSTSNILENSNVDNTESKKSGDESSNDNSVDSSTSYESTSDESDISSDSPSGGSSGSNNGGVSEGGSGGSSGGTSGGSESDPQTKTFSIDSYSFGYSMNNINVSPGDTVTINLTNSGGKHDWVVDEISGAATSIISGGQTDSITFTIPQSAAGNTYVFYCSVGNHRALGMQGNFVVSN